MNKILYTYELYKIRKNADLEKLAKIDNVS